MEHVLSIAHIIAGKISPTEHELNEKYDKISPRF